MVFKGIVQFTTTSPQIFCCYMGCRYHFVMHIYTLPDNENLDVKLLSYKVVMLLALANADRYSDLTAFDLSFRTYQTNGIQFVIPGLTKSRRSGAPSEAFYPKFTEDPKLCPVSALMIYEKTESFRRSSSQNPLFISIRKPVKPAAIGHWLKNFM